MAFIPYADPNLAAKTVPSQAGGGGGGGGWGDASPGYVLGANTNTSQDFVNAMAPYSQTGGSTSTFDPASYDQQIGNINTTLGQLGTQLGAGTATIDNSYGSAIQQLLAGKNQATRNYDQTKQQSALDYVGAKNSARVNAGNALSGLQRLLGSRGAGGGSAATIAAPQAVAGYGTDQLNGVGTTYGQNQQALDTNWNDYLQGYNGQVNSVTNQRDAQKQQLQNSIDTNRASLLQSLAQLQSQKSQGAGGNGVAASQPYLDQANSILAQLAGSVSPTINYQTQAYQAPSLASYTTSPAAQATAQGPTGSDYFSPFLSTLLGKKQQVGV